MDPYAELLCLPQILAKGDLEVDPNHTVEDVVLFLVRHSKNGDREYLVMEGAFTGIMTSGIPNDLF